MVCLENVVLVVSPCLPFPSATRRGDTGDFRGRSCFASCGYDHLQIGGYMWGLTDRGGVSVAVEVASVFAMLPMLVVLARTAIASVVLAPMVVLVEAGAMVVMLVVAGATMVMLVVAGAMVAVASVVAGAMVVARSAGGVSPIYMVDVGAVLPADGAVEVVGVAVFAPLSGREIAAHLAVAALPSVRVDVAIAVDAIKVGEVDVEDAVAVARSDTQFGYHLVGNDRGFRSHVGQSLGRGGDDHDEGGYGC